MRELPEYSNGPTLAPLRNEEAEPCFRALHFGEAKKHPGTGYHVEEMQRSWRTYGASGLAHVCAAGLLLALTVPVTENARRPPRSVTLLAPVLRPPVSIAPPHRLYEAKLPVRNGSAPVAIPKAAPENPAPAPMKPVSRSTEATLETPKAVDLEIPRPTPPPLTAELPAAPKVEVRTGTFDQTTAPAEASARTTVSVGAFGDGNSARSGGDARGSSAGAVRVGGFGDRTVSATGNRPPPQPETNAYTPVEILFKPKPVYTRDARDARVEGEVSLEVVFLATGEIRVGRVLRGLGHGLDEAAQQAAALVRFKPAMHGRVPVDTPATIRITFELT
jgi:TonB family protein